MTTQILLLHNFFLMTSTGFSALRKKRTTTTPKTPAQTTTVVAPPPKQGRPTKKDPTKQYVKIGANVPIETRTRMKLSLLTTAQGKHNTQDELIDFAIHYYLDTLERKN